MVRITNKSTFVLNNKFHLSIQHSVLEKIFVDSFFLKEIGCNFKIKRYFNVAREIQNL